jgi:LAGLIDADG endonuclease
MNADGHFGLRVRKSSTNLLGERCELKIRITQNNVSLLVLEEVQKYLGFGKIYCRNTNLASDFEIQNIRDVNNFIENFTHATL